MANLADLNAQQLARLGDIHTRQQQIARQIKNLRDNLAGIARDINRNTGLFPDDRTGQSYMTDALNAPTRQEFNRFRDVVEDLFAIMNNGNDVDGSAHTRNTASDTELTTWLDDFYERNLS